MTKPKLAIYAILLFTSFSCTTTSTPQQVPNAVQETQVSNEIEVMFESVKPGTSIRKGNTIIDLHKGSIAEGDLFPAALFTDVRGKDATLNGPGEVRLISVVPSIKTKVCDIQSHQLGESLSIHPRVKRVTISLDTSAEQAEFAAKAKLTQIAFLSDTKTGDFGRSTGLLMKDKPLLARAMIVVDTKGIVQYIQVVPDVTKLPDLDGAIAMANGLIEPAKKVK